jgi:TRAP-type C4-dicarboxylate transport system permease small subunit
MRLGMRTFTDALCKYSSAVAAVAVVVMTVLIFVGVVARYVFTCPLMFTDEYATYMLVVVVTIGASYTLRQGSHINVDIVTRMLPSRVASRIEAITNMLSVFCIVILIIETVRLVSMSFASGATVLAITYTPLWIVQLIMPIGFSLLLIEMSVTTARSINSAIQSQQDSKRGTEGPCSTKE